MHCSTGFALQKLDDTLNDATFVEITPANQWMTLYISNEGGATDLVLRSDGEDPSTEVTVAAGHGFAIATAMPACQNSIRFQPGKPAAYLKAAAGGSGVGAYLVWS